MKLSVIIPTYNEADHIESVIESIDRLDGVSKELLIADGGSTDGTCDKVLALQKRNPCIHLVQNPDKFVSHGFNRAFQQAQGEFISLVGAHAKYPQDYFSQCIRAIESGECDVAGGFLTHTGTNPVSQAISYAMGSHFGVGDSAFRTDRRKKYVDSVAFAVYDRKVFQTAGLLDEELIRNQDDELHYRLNRAGFRILLLPELEIEYYVRGTFARLFSQYYQYGYYKPLVLRKVSSGMRARHVVPSLFVIYLVSLPLSFLTLLWLLPLGLYSLICTMQSLRARTSLTTTIRIMLVFPILHIAYGLGFLVGLHRLWKK
jgi:glycosyltransferase involved in cell wall biosynthesis